MQFPRSAGVLLHITSLPGGFGVGDLGPAAIDFIDFLSDSDQRIWQVLPLGPPARGNSPYSCYSAFAGNPLLISPEQLLADRWIESADLSSLTFDSGRIERAHFGQAGDLKLSLLRVAFGRCRETLAANEDYQRFLCDHEFWLPEFAMFEALMHHFNDADWITWPEEIARRDETAMQQWSEKLAAEIEFSKFVQFVFDQQWHRVKRYANKHDVNIFGDMPIFVAFESADVWANQSLYELEPTGHRRLVAGVPPDYFSETGQLWGNPLYHWPSHRDTNYRWWIERFRFAFKQFDLLRVDHFRGFEAYWEIPASAETAMEGQWRTGPGSEPFDAAREALGPLPIIAEDLGMITEAVHELRKQLGYPAMRVLQFGFDDPNDVFHHPHHFPSDSVAYTGTHDNETLMGWYAQRPIEPEADRSLRQLIHGERPVHWQLIEQVLQSKSDTAIVPMQDLLGLDNDSRMNLPGQADGNWSWRMGTDVIADTITENLQSLTRAAGRSGETSAVA